MNLSVCMIVRDNEHMIRECLESIRPWVDEMIVVDTGSKDATPQIAESLGAKLFQFEWIDDFSAARNVSLEQASGKWLFWMDSDDTISAECGRKLRALADGQHASNTYGYVMQVRCPAIGKNGIEEFTVVDHVKMFRNDPRVRFEGRIHEQVLMPIRKIGGEIAWTDIYVVHSGSDYSPEGQRRKSERDLRILKKDLEERPDHPFVLFNFAMTYAELGRYKEALPWVEKCLAVSQPYESHVRKTYAYLANCHSQLEQESEALEACRRGRALFPDDAELLFREAMTLHSLKRFDEAIAKYRELLNLETTEELKSTDPSITGFKCRFNLGVCYSEAGRSAEAELQWREVLRDHASYRPALRSLTEQLRKDGKRITARVEAERMCAHRATRAEGLCVLGILEEDAENVPLAKQHFDEAVRDFGDDTHVRESASRFYFGNGFHEEAQNVIRHTVELEPENGAALHNLGALLLQQGRVEEAIQRLQQSLAVRPHALQTEQLLGAALEARRTEGPGLAS